MLTKRPPIIVILGHVDHGKTTLLDYLRKTNIAAREAGGITQSIRSFQMALPHEASAKGGQLLTFIDTPGHAAFSQMRLRGSGIADIAILIVAAGDGVMPQTIESIQAIKSAKIPFVVAINKIDLPGSDPDQVKTQLSDNDVIVEDLGGDIPAVSISAKTGKGIPELLEIISLIAGLNPPQADPSPELAEGFVLESRLDSHRGPVAAVIVKNGTLTPGQPLYQSQLIGKVKAIFSPENISLPSAPPSAPVEILGLTVVPEVGSLITAFPQARASVAPPAASAPASSFNIILKADVGGSLEAIRAALPPGITVLTAATGDVTENDVLTARNSSTRIIGFNVKAPAAVSKLAEVEKVRIDTFKIIYELLKELDLWIHPLETERITGRGDVIAEFKIGPDRVAGIRVTEGSFEKTAKVRLLRGGKVMGETKFKTLKQGKTDIPSVKSGSEFGATFSPYLDFKAGDLIISVASL